MAVKEFLNRIRKIDLLINCNLDEIEKLRNLLTGGAVRYDSEKVQTSSDNDRMTDTIAKIIELEKTINEDIDELVDKKIVAREMIERLDDDREKIILYKRYFDGKSFEQISVECNYSWKWVHVLHGNALKKLEKIWICS